MISFICYHGAYRDTLRNITVWNDGALLEGLRTLSCNWCVSPQLMYKSWIEVVVAKTSCYEIRPTHSGGSAISKILSILDTSDYLAKSNVLKKCSTIIRLQMTAFECLPQALFRHGLLPVLCSTEYYSRHHRNVVLPSRVDNLSRLLQLTTWRVIK